MADKTTLNHVDLLVPCAACGNQCKAPSDWVDSIKTDDSQVFLCTGCEIALVALPEPSELRTVGAMLGLAALCMLLAGLGAFALLMLLSLLF